MNTKNIFAGLLIATSSISAFAHEFATPSDEFVSTKTRAQVIAEVQEAKQQGTLATTEYDFNNPSSTFVSTRTRNEVIAELKEAQANGSYDILLREHDVPLAVQYTRGSAQIAGKGKAARAN